MEKSGTAQDPDQTVAIMIRLHPTLRKQWKFYCLTRDSSSQELLLEFITKCLQDAKNHK